MGTKAVTAPRITPDRFTQILGSIPLYKKLMSGFTLCGECERCERSVVYLTPEEQQSAKRVKLRMYGEGGAARINRDGCKCPYYVRETKLCGAYESRPLICRMFPIDLIENDDDGKFWWVAFTACEEVRRGKLKGRLAELKKLAQQIDKAMPKELKREYTADHANVVAEPVFHNFPIHYLVEASF